MNTEQKTTEGTPNEPFFTFKSAEDLQNYRNTAIEEFKSSDDFKKQLAQQKTNAIGEFMDKAVFKHLQKNNPKLYNEIQSKGIKEIEKVIDFALTFDKINPDEILHSERMRFETEKLEIENQFKTKATEYEQQIRNIKLGYESKQMQSAFTDKNFVANKYELAGLQKEFDDLYAIDLNDKGEVVYRNKKDNSLAYSKKPSQSPTVATFDEIFEEFRNTRDAKYRVATHIKTAQTAPTFDTENEISEYFANRLKEETSGLSGNDYIKKQNEITVLKNKELMRLRSKKG